MSRFRPTAIAVLAIVISQLAITPVLARPLGDEAPARPARPNIVLILSDDQRVDMMGAMPTVRSRLIDRGVSFSERLRGGPAVLPVAGDDPPWSVFAHHADLRHLASVRRGGTVQGPRPGAVHDRDMAAGCRLSHRDDRQVPERLRLDVVGRAGLERLERLGRHDRAGPVLRVPAQHERPHDLVRQLARGLLDRRPGGSSRRVHPDDAREEAALPVFRPHGAAPAGRAGAPSPRRSAVQRRCEHRLRPRTDRSTSFVQRSGPR